MPRSRRYGEHAPLRQGRAHRRHWLRTAELNIVGWSALVGLCAAAGGVGVLVARAIGPSGRYGAVFALVPVGGVILADRRRWAGMETNFGWGGSVDEVTRIVEELRSRGVDAQVRPDFRLDQPWWDRIEPQSDAPDEPTASLVYANRHRVKVRATLRSHGIQLPEMW